MRMLRKIHQRGVALITAMIIVALAAIVAADLAWDNALDVRRTTMLLYRDQGIQVALGAENWIAAILRQDLQDTETDHLDEIWATQLPPLPIDGGEVFGVIEDLSGRFNINSLVDQDGEIVQERLEQFQRLLVALELEPRFAGLAADWLDRDDQASFPDGGEDGIYTSLTPPYRTPNQLLSSTAELAALEGMDKLTFDTLAPHIVALPGATRINVNTATPFVLQSLGEQITTGDVEGLLSDREDGGFTDYETAFDGLVTPDVLNDQLSETSDYFQLKVVVRIDTVQITLFTILQRGTNGNVSTILRSFGTA